MNQFVTDLCPFGKDEIYLQIRVKNPTEASGWDVS